MLLEKCHIFFLKGFCAVMLGLIGYIYSDGRTIGNTHCESTVTGLPRKILYSDGFVNPSR